MYLMSQEHYLDLTGAEAVARASVPAPSPRYRGCPMVYICSPFAGENDLILQSETKKIADRIPNSTMIILEGEDHGSYIVNSKIMGELIDFLNREWLE